MSTLPATWLQGEEWRHPEGEADSKRVRALGFPSAPPQLCLSSPRPGVGPGTGLHPHPAASRHHRGRVEWWTLEAEPGLGLREVSRVNEAWGGAGVAGIKTSDGPGHTAG